MQEKDEQIGLPDLGHEGERQCRNRADGIKGDEGSAPGQSLGDRSGDGREADIGDHLDREYRSQDQRGVSAGEVVCQETKGDGHQPRPEKGGNLRGEERAERTI